MCLSSRSATHRHQLRSHQHQRRSRNCSRPSLRHMRPASKLQLKPRRHRHRRRLVRNVTERIKQLNHYRHPLRHLCLSTATLTPDSWNHVVHRSVVVVDYKRKGSAAWRTTRWNSQARMRIKRTCRFEVRNSTARGDLDNISLPVCRLNNGVRERKKGSHLSRRRVGSCHRSLSGEEPRSPSLLRRQLEQARSEGSPDCNSPDMTTPVTEPWPFVEDRVRIACRPFRSGRGTQTLLRCRRRSFRCHLRGTLAARPRTRR